VWRNWRAGFVLSAAVVAVAVPTASPSVSAPADRLPDNDQVARIYPQVAGGQVVVSDPGARGYFGLLDQCLSPRVLDQARRRVSVSYLMSDGRSPSAAGADDPSAAVYRFRSERQARGAIRGVRAFLRECAGVHQAPPTNEFLTLLAMPGLAARSTAFRRETSYYDASTNTVHSWLWVAVMVQRGDRLVTAYAFSYLDRPDVANVVRLARLVLRASRGST
jgi:hypothetical protein